MRDEDSEVRTTQAELRDLHHRIDSLKDEGERQYSSLTDKLHGLTDKLHALEVAIAHGTRFPAAAWVAAAGLVLSTVGTGAVLYSQQQMAISTSTKALTLIEDHLKSAPAHRYNVERLGTLMDSMQGEVPVLSERVKALESRVVGQGPDGWHRRDHDTYAAMVATQIGSLERRVQTAEEQQQHVCDRVRACK